MNPEDQTIQILFVNCQQKDVTFAVKELSKEVIHFTYLCADDDAEFKRQLAVCHPNVVIAGCSHDNSYNLNNLHITRTISSQIPFILLTSAEHEKNALECLKAGATDYVLEGHFIRLPFTVSNAVEKQKYQIQKRITEEKLEENEEIYRYIIENSNNAVFLIKNKKFEVVNSEFQRMFEYSIDDVSQPGFSLMKLVAPEYSHLFEESYRKMSDGKNVRQRFEFTAITKNGTRKEVDAWITHNIIKGDTITQGIIRDVTHGKLIEKNLRESEKKFRTLFLNHSAVKLIVDPENGNIIEANKAAAAFYGWSVEELQKMNVSEINFLPPREVSKKMEATSYPQNIFSELRHLNSKGEVVDVEIFSSQVNYEGKKVLHFIIHDITARKKVEQKLHLLNHAVEQNPVSIVITNPEGKIEYVNPEFTSMTGYTLDEVLDKYPRILKSGYQTEEFYQKFWNTISSGDNWEGEFKNKKKNGEIYWQESSISPILDENGLITHYVAVLEDITEKKKMIEDLVLAKEKAEESDRLKSAFLANMSHEIRTPMNGIIGFTDLLKEQKLTGKEKIKYINIIKKSGERMLNTINDLIEISQIESGTMEVEPGDVNINDQMDGFYHQFIAESESKGLKLSCHKGLPDSQALILSDGKKINAIFCNLLKNAIKYTFSGTIDFGYELKHNQIEFFVKDTGIGIEPNRHKIIFDRFVQADMSLTKPYEGAGLGLSIAKAYVGMLEGEIWLESKPLAGTQFYFTIPYRSNSVHAQETITLSPETGENDLLKDLTILVAEDDAIGKLYLSELLNGNCKDIMFASDGLEALQLFKSNRGKIDIVLMDIKMPGLNGYQTTQKMKEINDQVFIIAQTAYALSGDREKAIASGCDFYLAKPFSKAQLLEAVKQYYC